MDLNARSPLEGYNNAGCAHHHIRIAVTHIPVDGFLTDVILIDGELTGTPGIEQERAPVPDLVKDPELIPKEDKCRSHRKWRDAQYLSE